MTLSIPSLSGDAAVSKGERRAVVSRDEKIGPPVPVHVRHGERLCVTRDGEAALIGADGAEVPPSVAAQQLAKAAVEAAHRRYRRVRVLKRVDVGAPVTVKVARGEPLDRGDLRYARERLKLKRPVGPAEEHPAAQLRRCEARGP